MTLTWADSKVSDKDPLNTQILTKLSEVGLAVPFETVFEALSFIPSATMINITETYKRLQIILCFILTFNTPIRKKSIF